ncbi:TatD family deoxyribonuclease [Paenibacillus sambharensis]|uniref:TatD family deoxyribonuclease n=1 Tax=Paenibacillus sambharensis TaxID=1803190 RepID=A0A2W1L2Y5_9BACL|nr:TatD family hydrolase [Paenibacillus sambharensis]PZD93706.1 TatD family deoxyribonuclease [Paenibacillus sambharensis]
MNAGFAWIDAHIHLDAYRDDERDGLLQHAAAAGMEAVVAVSMNLESCRATRQLALAWPGQVMPAYGYHPEQAVPDEAQTERLTAWIRERHQAGERFAIGEVGLPYYRRTEAAAAGERFDEQPYLQLLERFIRLAAELDRPVVLHAVYEDAAKACDMLERCGVRRAHFHWFKGPAETVARMAAAGYYVSITPDVRYEAEIQALVRQYPLTQLMVETDGPWPFEGQYAGRRTTPAMAADVVAEIAALKGQPLPETAAVLLQGTKAFYGIG